MKHWIILGAACLVLSGCGNAHWHSINRSFSPGAGDSRLIDAKQRAIISIVDTSGAYKGTCAEPSPDALQATAAALGGSGSLSKEDITAAVNLALSSTESAASIGLRTQSIQLLRDAYYRICEGYLSGGLDQVSYDVLQRRFQNHMIALLAVEQLTGVVKAEQVALTSQSVADAGAQLGVLTAELRKQRGELNDLQKRKQALDEEIAKLKADIEQQTDAEEKKKQEASLKDKESDQKTLETLVADQEKVVASMQSAVDKASLKTITAQSSTSATPVGGGTGAERTQALSSNVAKAVTDITLAAINSDYTGQVCTEAFRQRKGNAPAAGEKNAVAVADKNARGTAGTPAPEVGATSAAEGGVAQGGAQAVAGRGTQPSAGSEEPPPAGDEIFRTFCNKVLDQIVEARTTLTEVAVDIERERAAACKSLAQATLTVVDKLKKDITVAEASAVLKDVAVAQMGCGSLDTRMSGQPILLVPGATIKGGQTEQATKAE